MPPFPATTHCTPNYHLPIAVPDTVEMFTFTGLNTGSSWPATAQTVRTPSASVIPDTFPTNKRSGNPEIPVGVKHSCIADNDLISILAYNKQKYASGLQLLYPIIYRERIGLLTCLRLSSLLSYRLG